MDPGQTKFCFIITIVNAFALRLNTTQQKHEQIMQSLPVSGYQVKIIFVFSTLVTINYSYILRALRFVRITFSATNSV